MLRNPLNPGAWLTTKAQHSIRREVSLGLMWARIYSRHSVSLAKLYSTVLQNADLGRIDRLRDEMKPLLDREPLGAAKYTDYGYWLPWNAVRVGALSLQKSRRLEILDIGCGPGYFIAAARACGHECYGVDAPFDAMSEVEKRVYGEITTALSCNTFISHLSIERFAPMSVPHRNLDVITAFAICFNRHRQEDEWGLPEWRFFVEDSMSHLGNGGLLHLELNANLERYHSLKFYDSETREFFDSVGTVRGGIVNIHNEKLAE